MADIHILTSTRRRTTIITQAAFHIAIPSEYQCAEAAIDCADFESAVPDIDTAELDAIRAGEMVEVVHGVRHTINTNDADILVYARSLYAEEESRAVNDYRIQYWRYLETFASE